jgi:predicted GIY-YIG superfamily endonuclease
MNGVYLFHFQPNYKHARHYLGYADDILRRLEEHRNSQGARLTEVALKAGCELWLVRMWPNRGRHFERQLKRRKNSPRLCPICSGTIPEEWVLPEPSQYEEITF